MRLKVSSLSLLTSMALVLSSGAFAAGKKGKAHDKAVKECTEKGGTWNKKAKKCDNAQQETPAAQTDAPAPDKTPESPAPDAPAPE